MVKPLTFKGDKKPKKRKRTADTDNGSSTALTRTDVSAAAGASTALNETDAAAAEEDDSWVSAEVPSDISGPVVLVLPSDPPTALSCDAAGKVFAIPLENIVDANPATAEPHDVRQVWVASRLSGSESFRLKGHHGQYLSCDDRTGTLSANADAVSPLESFNIIPTPEGEGPVGTFQVMTLRDTFLSATDDKDRGSEVVRIRGDAESVTFATTVRIRMQARFKPRIKASKQEKALAKISRKELEAAAGRRLDEDEVRVLKRARKEGNYHERLLDIKVKNKHDKWG